VSFAQGEKVRVAPRPHEGHHRTPGYLKGKPGTIAHVHERFLNPETRAYGEDGEPAQRLYLVAFDQREVWADYHGSADDRLLADLFEHWLEKDE